MSEANNAPRAYCSEQAKSQDLPLLGTAPQVDVWLMLEYQSTWLAKAIDDNTLPESVNQWLTNLVRDYKTQGLIARPQFVRRRRDRDGEITFFIGTDAGLWQYDVADYDALCELQPTPNSDTAITQPHYFVCTNGRRDVCCSKFGLPVYRALRERLGERAWETSHVGGHRYAANVVVLPQGVLYGNLDPESVADFVDDIEAGNVNLAHLRGRSAYPNVAQVAETALSDNLREPYELLSYDDTSATFRTDEGERTINVTRSPTPITTTPSCGADTETFYPLQLA